MKAPAGYANRTKEAAIDHAREPLPDPPPETQARMASHLREPTHAYTDFELARDVYLGHGERLPTQILDYDAAFDRFWCAGPDCQGLVFASDTHTAESLDLAQRFDKALRPHLVGLEAPAERDEMTRAYLRGDLNRAALSRLRRARSSARAAGASRPIVEDRYKKVGDWLCDRVAERGVFERVIEEAERMQRSDPDAWKRIAGRTLQPGTLRIYWQRHVDPTRKRTALEAYARAQARKKIT